jgi:hypothetical protein
MLTPLVDLSDKHIRRPRIASAVIRFVETSTVITILDRLEKKDLVFRERSKEDKRKVHAYLTDEAMSLLIDAPLPLQDHLSRQFNDLPDWEQTMLISSLQRVAHMMNAEHIDASPVLDVGTIDRQAPQEDNKSMYEQEKK